jgi:anti-sigma factor ChrR (cupin superfamily)
LRDSEGWRVVTPGVEYKLLAYDRRANSKSFLLRAQSGVALPGHAHEGDEECLVLEGEFGIGDLTLRAGDFHFAPRGSRHPDATTRAGVLVFLRSCLGDYPFVVP